MSALRDLVVRWQADADVLERWGAPAQAAALRTCAQELEEHRTAWELEQLTGKQAAQESGYSATQLRRQFPGRKTIPRRDLPRKAAKQPDGPALALRVLADKGK